VADVGAPGVPGWKLQALLLALAAGLAGFSILWWIQPHDEGLMLQAGSRIASGEWPYSDFWMNYMPGMALVIAGLQKVFGASLLSWRVLVVALDALVSLLAYLLEGRGGMQHTALTAWLAVAGAMAYPFLPGPNPPALALGLGGLLAARQRPRTAGALAGLACFFRLEIGIAAIIGVALEAPRGERTKTIAPAVACALIPLAPFFIAAPGAMLHDTIGFYGIQNLQRLPFPISYHGAVTAAKLFDFYMPLILVVGGGVWLLATAAEWRRLDPGALSLVPLGLVGLAYLLGRTDENHLVPLAVVLPVMLAWASGIARRRALQLVTAAVVAVIALHGLERRGSQLIHAPTLAAVPGPAGDGVETTPSDARALKGLEGELARITKPREPIFVANPRFDLVHAGDPLLFVITGHPNPTKYDVMQPGVVTTASVQRQIIEELQRSHTTVVVRWLSPLATLSEADGAGRSSGVNLLGDYIAASYRPIAKFGYYQVLLARGAEATT
jgi:hypothetical protein